MRVTPGASGAPIRRSPEGGFTVVELVIAMGILMLILGGVLFTLESGVRNERGQQARSDALDELRGAMGRMSKEVRQALSIQLTSTTANLDVQTLINGVEHRVVYAVSCNGACDGGSDDKLQRTVDPGVGVQAVPLATGLSSSAVFCFDPPGCVATNPSSTTPRIIRLTIKVRPRAPGSTPVTLSTEVQLRNTESS